MTSWQALGIYGMDAPSGDMDPDDVLAWAEYLIAGSEHPDPEWLEWKAEAEAVIAARDAGGG